MDGMGRPPQLAWVMKLEIPGLDCGWYRVPLILVSSLDLLCPGIHTNKPLLLSGAWHGGTLIVLTRFARGKDTNKSLSLIMDGMGKPSHFAGAVVLIGPLWECG